MTSIEWLIKELYTEMNMSGDGRVLDEILEQAKEMHKRETIKFGYDFFASIEESEECIITKLPEELYKETFKKD